MKKVTLSIEFSNSCESFIFDMEMDQKEKEFLERFIKKSDEAGKNDPMASWIEILTAYAEESDQQCCKAERRIKMWKKKHAKNAEEARRLVEEQLKQNTAMQKAAVEYQHNHHN